jgi:hypothetical protein
VSTRTTTAAVAVAAAFLLAACSSGSSHDASAKPATAAAAAKLSTTWVPKLKALAGGDGMKDCSTDSGSSGCAKAIADSVGLFTQITDAIGVAGGADQYSPTITKITELVGDADTYTKDSCPGDPNADIDGSPCPKDALAVVVGVSALQMVMQTDEANAGA